MDTKAFRHLNKRMADAAVELFKGIQGSSPTTLDNVAVFNKNELGVEEGQIMKRFNSFVVAPMIREKVTIGFLLILSHDEKTKYSESDLENAFFIAEQSALSFENAEKFARAKELAFVDSLTELYNPKFLNVALEREIKRSNRSKVPFSVLFMDLDHFKQVNDVHGHLIGSKVLIEVSKLLIESVRDIDTVIRYGGDEYTMILVDTDHQTAIMVAERIREAIEKNNFLDEDKLSLKITASIGLATYPLHAQSKEQLLEMADQAMYCGKERSRNIVFAAPVPDKESLQ